MTESKTEKRQRLYDNIWKNKSLHRLKKKFTPEELEEAYDAGLLRKEQLEHGKYYAGSCRNASIARWDEKTQLFTYVRTKFRDKFTETICHPADDNGYDLFICLYEDVPEKEENIDDYNN